MNERGREVFQEFHGVNPDEVIRISDSELVPEKQLFLLGVLESVGYIPPEFSDKDPDSVYVHHFGEDGGEKPLLCAGIRRKRLYVVRGDYTVNDWLRG
jgi:hypothetical protein